MPVLCRFHYGLKMCNNLLIIQHNYEVNQSGKLMKISVGNF